MKLTKIKIVNFGQFSNFDFDLTNSKLNVFFGKNEAGKSTIVAFIKQIMFGFHLASQNSAFFEDYQPLARVSPMGGSLFFENNQGDSYELERLYASGKGSKLGTLTVKRNNQIVPESTFFDQIKNIDGDFYADSFIFNQDMLAKVNKIQQTDLLERIYYLGAANSDKLIDLRDDFAKKASDLFKKAGSKPPLNRLLVQLKNQRAQVDMAENEFIDYKELNSQYVESTQALKKQDQDLQVLQKELNRLQQLQKLLPNYQELTELKAQIEPVNFDQEQYESAQSLVLQVENLKKNNQELQNSLEKLKQENIDSERANKLVQRKPEVLQWRSEYHSCEQKQQQITSEEQQLIALNPDLAQIADMNQDEIIKLQNEFDQLPKNKNEVFSTSKIGLYWLAGGLAFIFIGIILLSKMPLAGGIGLIAGISAVVVGLFRQRKEKNLQREFEAKRSQKENIRTDFIHKYGLQIDRLDIHNLINAWRQYQLQEQNKLATKQQEDDLKKQTHKLAEQIGDILLKPIATDFESLIAALDLIETHLSTARQQVEKRVSFQNTIKENNERLKETELKLRATLAEAHVVDMEQYKFLQAKKQKQAALKTKIKVLTANLEQDMSQLKELQANTSLANKKQAELELKIKRQQASISQLQTKIAEINVKMTSLANSSSVYKAKQELANTQTQFQKLSVEYLANLSASKWIARALDLASNERFPKMLVAAKEYLRLLTNNRYNNIEIDKEITITRVDGKKIKVQYLSRGTSEQLYFALKLAFVQQIKDQISLPILIDDSFVNFDDQRVDQINQLLKQVAENNQVLIFTAQSSLVEKLQLQPLTFTKGTDNV